MLKNAEHLSQPRNEAAAHSLHKPCRTEMGTSRPRLLIDARRACRIDDCAVLERASDNRSAAYSGDDSKAAAQVTAIRPY